MILRGHILNPGAAGGLVETADGGLRLDADGRILEVAPFAALAPGEPVLDLRPCWILPGLIDLHTHLPQYPEVARDGLELLDWLEARIFPAEAAWADPALAARGARRALGDLLAAGTTTVAAYATVHPEGAQAAFEAAEALGLRAIIGQVLMDRAAPPALLRPAATALGESAELCRAWHGRDGGRLQYAFTPRFALSCSRDLMAGAGELAERTGAWVQTHLSESLGEVARVAEEFPEALDYTDVYARARLLGPRTLLAHGIHLAPRERGALRASGAALVHCPRSNAFLASGIMPLRRWREEGLKVGLGTDVGAGPSLDLWSEMGFACAASKLRGAERRALAARLKAVAGAEAPRLAEALDLGPEPPLRPAEAFRLATLGGAEALGLGAVLGSLEAGKEADFIVVDPAAADPAPDRGPERAEDVLARLIYRPVPGLVQAAYVRGRRCHPAEA